MIYETVGYKAIAKYYGSHRAKRSGVLLIDHIHQGIEILKRIGADEVTMEAYAVHPIFQADGDLRANFYSCADLNPLVVLYAMEYRNIANAFLSNKVEKGPDSFGQTDVYAKHPIKLSPLAPVNQMLIADKIQNRKDFLRYHKDSHPRSDELDFYFKTWLAVLDVSEEQYLELIKDL